MPEPVQKKIKQKQNFFNTEKQNELRKELQKAARAYLAEDKRLEGFCKKYSSFSAINLSHYGLAKAKKFDPKLVVASK